MIIIKLCLKKIIFSFVATVNVTFSVPDWVKRITGDAPTFHFEGNGLVTFSAGVWRTTCYVDEICGQILHSRAYAGYRAGVAKVVLSLEVPARDDKPKYGVWHVVDTSPPSVEIIFSIGNTYFKPTYSGMLRVLMNHGYLSMSDLAVLQIELASACRTFCDTQWLSVPGFCLPLVSTSYKPPEIIRGESKKVQRQRKERRKLIQEQIREAIDVKSDRLMELRTAISKAQDSERKILERFFITHHGVILFLIEVNSCLNTIYSKARHKITMNVNEILHMIKVFFYRCHPAAFLLLVALIAGPT